MRVLILGCGYIGLAVGRQLVAGRHEVWGVRRDPASAASMEEAGIHPLIGDLTSHGFLQSLPIMADAVINATSSKGGGPEGYRSLYLGGTKQVLRAAKAWPLRRYVHIGSTSVYGQIDGGWVDESSPAEPASETSAVLRDTERLLLSEFAGSNAQLVLLRSAGIYGPARGHLFQQFLRGEARMTGEGGRWLNMIHRSDLADAVVCATTQPCLDPVLNVSDDTPCTEREFYEWLASETGLPLPPPAGESAVPRKRGTTNKRIRNDRLKRLLNRDLRFPSFREGYGALLRDSSPPD